MHKNDNINQFMRVSMHILAIESSCDETAVAVYRASDNKIFDNIHSQACEHARHGGVVPELAARDHQEKIVKVCQKTLIQAQIELSDIDAFAYTKGPGLVGPLLIGCSFTKALAAACRRPVLPIHHLEAHLCIAKYVFSELDFPFLALLVSGGHTAIIKAHALGKYEILGETLDDAAGEAFDKGAKVLGLEYPGGPSIARAAQMYKKEYKRPSLPQPMSKKKTLNFSFSGLKTAFNQAWQASYHSEEARYAFAYSLQETITDNLISKVRIAMQQEQGLPWVVAGGVAANKSMRSKLDKLKEVTGCCMYYPPAELCTDNAAMIAYTAFLKIQSGQNNVTDSKAFADVLPRWSIDQL
ncbi:MAG: tRNA (adenosine(37)-N6)-threonylcarbamoyltransferase complex transferase subunit TsaD [Pseudomonadota bacterium]|nr:tRNA (adenosine(37)-N6)-threonylcarbamoyltransferase complex transferase subunit TsaD [Pseudomonadota bacterium]